ncbi:MAG: M48 family metalloprotease, partial [Candidatus Omnitrophota bacterium]
MSFSFIDIEEKKSRIIALVFLSVILFYFLTAYILLVVIENSYVFYLREAKEHSFFLPPLYHALGVLAIAFLAALFHWLISTGNLIEKMSAAIGAMPVDPKDTYHQYFKNIVDEVSVATGGKPIEAMIIPFSDLNSFSLQEFSRRAVIGVTESLLARLNRDQIEAVVGHEAGHIVGGDSLTTTVICSLSEIYEESISGIKAGLKSTRTRGRGGVILLLILIVLSVMHFLSNLLRYFISRQREYRA